MYCTAYSTSKAEGAPNNGLSLVQEDIQGFMPAMHGQSKDQLDLIIHSPGGHVEAVEQIINYLLSKYSHIRAIVPQSAMSAATMLACACDEIVMGKHSAIGPISFCAESIEWKSRSRDSGVGAGTKLVLRSDSGGRLA